VSPNSCCMSSPPTHDFLSTSTVMNLNNLNLNGADCTFGHKRKENDLSHATAETILLSISLLPHESRSMPYGHHKGCVQRKMICRIPTCSCYSGDYLGLFSVFGTQILMHHFSTYHMVLSTHRLPLCKGNGAVV